MVYWLLVSLSPCMIPFMIPCKLTLVFTTSDPYQRWNGISSKKPHGNEGFVWYAEYLIKNNQKRVQKGNLLVLH